MPDPVRFLQRHGNLLAAAFISLLAVIGLEQDGATGFLLPASLLVAAALATHAAERMAILEHRADWRDAARREVELRSQFASLRVTLSEI